jgi:hypothetical protein
MSNVRHTEKRMSADKSEIQAILKRVEETLDTAKQGLGDLVDPSHCLRSLRHVCHPKPPWRRGVELRCLVRATPTGNEERPSNALLR